MMKRLRTSVQLDPTFNVGGGVLSEAESALLLGVRACFRLLVEADCGRKTGFSAGVATGVLALGLGPAHAAVSAAWRVMASGVRSLGSMWVAWRQMASISGLHLDSVEGGGASARWGLPVISS